MRATCGPAGGRTFLSTLSLRRATHSDIIRASVFCHFYPRSPCGERHFPGSNPVRDSQFLSTLSLRRATKITITVDDGTIISIHALLAESDIYCHCFGTSYSNFYPRSPCGERPGNIGSAGTARPTISIHALLAESDLFSTWAARISM